MNDNCDSICDGVRVINALTLIDCNPNLLKISHGELNTFCAIKFVSILLRIGFIISLFIGRESSVCILCKGPRTSWATRRLPFRK